MASLNRVFLMGNLTRDPELRLIGNTAWKCYTCHGAGVVPAPRTLEVK